MKYCDYCNEANSEDSMYCKKCGRPLYEEIEEKKKQEKVKKEKTKKTKKVKKTKPKKKVIHETKVIDQREKGRMSFFQKFMMFFLFLLCMVSIGAVAVLGYHIYQTENITVPDVTGLTYEEAEIRLQDVGLNASKIEVVTEDESEVGIVLKQKKRGGAKVSENTVIELSIGVLDTTVEVPDVEGKTLEEALELCTEQGITYQIVYEESEETPNTVLKQSIRKGKKIENTEVLVLTVSKEKEPVKETEEPTETPTETPTDEEEIEGE